MVSEREDEVSHQAMLTPGIPRNPSRPVSVWFTGIQELPKAINILMYKYNQSSIEAI